MKPVTRPPPQGLYEFLAEQRTSRVQYDQHRRELSDGRVVRVVAGFRRDSNFDQEDKPGEDYCAVRCDDRHAVVVVADGVSESFVGSLAARAVGAALLDILWERRSAPPVSEELAQALEGARRRLQEEIAGYQVRTKIEALRDELEERRRRDGSQAVFGVVVVDLAERRGTLYLLGDILVLVHPARGAPHAPEAPPKGRWSSLAGVKGAVQVIQLPDVASVMLKSDGVGRDWGTDPASVVRRQNFEELAHAQCLRDDMSFVWVDTAASPDAGQVQLLTGTTPPVEAAPAPPDGSPQATAPLPKTLPKTHPSLQPYERTPASASSAASRGTPPVTGAAPATPAAPFPQARIGGFRAIFDGVFPDRRAVVVAFAAYTLGVGTALGAYWVGKALRSVSPLEHVDPSPPPGLTQQQYPIERVNLPPSPDAPSWTRPFAPTTPTPAPRNPAPSAPVASGQRAGSGAHVDVRGPPERRPAQPLARPVRTLAADAGVSAMREGGVASADVASPDGPVGATQY